MVPFIFPNPRSAQFKKSKIDLRKSKWIKIDPKASGTFIENVREFIDAIKSIFGSRPSIIKGTPETLRQVQGFELNRKAGATLLSVAIGDKTIPEQGYELETKGNSILLKSRDERGAFYGLQTLKQILLQTGATPPAFRISDYPDFASRGVMLDVSRSKVPKMETLFNYIDILAALKINQLQLYTEHTFAFSAHESVWFDASPITADEVLALDAYAKKRYIELVPNLNSFGHFERWLRHPEYKRLAECPEGFTTPWGIKMHSGSVLKPNDESIKFLDSLYAEFLPNFSSKLFNVGCDETWELGQGWSKPLCEKKGTVRVYLDFLLKIYKLARKYGRRIMFWGDIILHEPKLIKELPKDITALEWGYEANHPFDKDGKLFEVAGVPFYVCPGTSSWNSLTGRTTNCIENIANAAENGIKHGAIGFLNTDWGDGGHHQYQPISYLGICAGAAYSWRWKSNKDVNVERAMDDLIFQDKAHVAGKLFSELGKVLELIPKETFNSSIFNQLLFGALGDKKILEGVSAKDLHSAIKRLNELEEKISDTRMAAPDAELIKEELKNSIAMARHGAMRGLAGLDKEYFDAPMLRRDLQHIIGLHKDLWLARNRRGGLRKSSERLRDLLKDYC